MKNKLRLKFLVRRKKLLVISVLGREDGSFTLNQAQLIDKLVLDLNMNNSQEIGSPLDAPLVVGVHHAKPLAALQHALYRIETGNQMYMSTRTSSDLAVICGVLTAYAHVPATARMHSAKTALQKLRGRFTTDMLAQLKIGTKLIAYAHISCANEAEKNRQSRTGFMIMYRNAFIAVTSNLKTCAILSSTKALYLSLAEATKAIMCLKKILNKSGVT